MVRPFVFVVAVLSVACGGDGNESPNPISPTPAPPVAANPTPAPAPVNPLVRIDGTWNGTHEMQFSGQRTFSFMTMALTQNDRLIRGTWRLTSPGWDIHGDVEGTILGDGTSQRFTGSVSLIGETSTGTGRCTGTAAVNSEGALTASSMRWLGPNISSPNCVNNIGGLVWIVSK
jgi:hypothetical protein